MPSHKDPKIVEVFQVRIGGTFAALCVFDSDVDTLANGLKERLLSTAEEVFWGERKKTQPWITGEVRPETATETTEVHKPRSRTRVHRSEQRS